MHKHAKKINIQNIKPNQHNLEGLKVKKIKFNDQAKKIKKIQVPKRKNAMNNGGEHANESTKAVATQ
jgi:hypothetical protein